MKAMTLRLPDDLHEQLRQEAFEKRTSITALILEALANRRRSLPGDAEMEARHHQFVDGRYTARVLGEWKEED